MAEVRKGYRSWEKAHRRIQKQIKATQHSRVTMTADYLNLIIHRLFWSYDCFLCDVPVLLFYIFLSWCSWVLFFFTTVAIIYRGLLLS